MTENQELEDLLGVEQAKVKELDSQVVRLQAEFRTITQRTERAETKEKELSEKVKEQASRLLYNLSLFKSNCKFRSVSCKL